MELLQTSICKKTFGTIVENGERLNKAQQIKFKSYDY